MGGGSTYKYSINEGANYYSLLGYGYTDPNTNTYFYGFYFKANTSLDSAWSVGDGIYTLRSVDSSTDGDGYIGPAIYTLDYKVPAATDLFGKSVYIDYEYPLKNLLPITKSGYALIQKEAFSGEQTWYDLEGNEFKENFTFYTFHINNDNENVNGNSRNACIPYYGDIDLQQSLSQYNVFYYSGGSLKSENGYFYKTTGNGVPPYFTTPDTSIVDALKSNMESTMDGALAISEGDYSGNLVSLASDSVLGGLTP